MHINSSTGRKLLYIACKITKGVIKEYQSLQQIPWQWPTAVCHCMWLVPADRQTIDTMAMANSCLPLHVISTSRQTDNRYHGNGQQLFATAYDYYQPTARQQIPWQWPTAVCHCMWLVTADRQTTHIISSIHWRQTYEHRFLFHFYVSWLIFIARCWEQFSIWIRFSLYDLHVEL